MRLRLRLLYVLLASFFRRHVRVVEESVLNLIVFPNDVDVSKMSADRYLALTDLGRVNIVARAGLLRQMLASRHLPVAHVATMRFRRPLRLFEKYRLRSRVIWWDEAWVWCEHHFERQGSTVAMAIVKVMLIGPGGRLPVSTWLLAAGESLAPPAPLPIVGELQLAEVRLREMQR
ncbi:thioesterase family protein [Lysobacter solisilvae (ex Woo and Kim 2020)]|uniref:Thioesterase family protein n=1 Tax=Agrilutibacter terrestris TaxID=2865112 RepID=A0A7H0FVK6_9GAMM|nr:thioesterase family protein [Lysobacter terrestris]QNP40072.1 thioesterase family protein [Lysobacter terrestris]